MKTIGTKRKLLLASALGASLALGQGAFARTATTQASHAHKTVKKAKRAAAPVSTRSAATASSAAPVAMPATARSVSAQRNAFAPVADGATRCGSENIVVTGSALSTSNNANANPVQIITAKQIMQTGASTVGDYLQRLPSVGSSGTYNSQTNVSVRF